MVACASVPNITFEHGSKEVPLTVNMNIVAPAGTEVAVPTGGVNSDKL